MPLLKLLLDVRGGSKLTQSRYFSNADSLMFLAVSGEIKSWLGESDGGI